MRVTKPNQSTQEVVLEPTAEQMRRAKGIARKTQQPVQDVLAEAVKRGSAAQLSELVAGQPHRAEFLKH